MVGTSIFRGSWNGHWYLDLSHSATPGHQVLGTTSSAGCHVETWINGDLCGYKESIHKWPPGTPKNRDICIYLRRMQRKPVRIWELEPALWGSSGTHGISIVCAHVCIAPGICIGIYIYIHIDIQAQTIIMYDLAKASVSNMVTGFFGYVQHLRIGSSVVFFASQGLTRFASARILF